MLYINPTSIYAQSWDLPPNSANNRHFTDQYVTMRPALTVRGFDNTTITTSDPHRLQIHGIKQVLSKSLGKGESQDLSVFKVLERIQTESLKPTYIPSDAIDLEDNYSIMKSKAAYAVLSYVVTKNDGDPGEPSIFMSNELPYHADIRDDMLDFLKNPPTMYFPGYPDSQPFKNVKAGMNLVQMWDMYLAYENACLYYENTTYCDSILLTYNEKQAWNEIIEEYVQTIFWDTRKPILTVGGHEMQAGNWPLISFVGTGYMLMGYNGTFPLIDDPETDTTATDQDIIGLANLSTYSTKLSPSGGPEPRRYYFNYQSSEGERYWAEGAYYFSISLEYIVPYFHALRANGKLPVVHADGTLTDPFVDPKFLNPVEWLADIATPEGKTPPIDDGNKVWIYPAQILNWSSDYGNSTTGNIGAKYQRIVDQEEQDAPDMPNGWGYGKFNWLNLVELAIPRHQNTTYTYSDRVVGNTDPEQLGDQQVILNYVDSQERKHYILFNGEHGDAITRGEGHEQPDQNQVLYYINNVSRLIDPGYDSAGGSGNSTWNEYRDHSVIHHTYNNYGGLASPSVAPLLGRKVSEHTQMTKLYHATPSSKITNISGSIPIRYLNGSDFADVRYDRELLFVRDKAYSFGTIPVQLVDYNSLSPIASSGNFYNWRMQYRFQGTLQVPYGGSVGWTTNFASASTEPTHIFFTAVDFTPNVSYNEWDTYTETVREPDGNTYSQNIFVKNALSSYHFGTIAVLTTGDDPPPNNPELLTMTSSVPAKVVQVRHHTHAIDIVVKRSTASTTAERASAVAFKVPDASDYPLYLPGDIDYGFARLIYDGSSWAMDSDFTVNLMYDYNNIYVSKTYTNPTFDATDGTACTCSTGSRAHRLAFRSVET